MIITIKFIFIWQCKHNFAWFLLLLSPKKQGSASLSATYMIFSLPVGADQDTRSWSSLTQWGEGAGAHFQNMGLSSCWSFMREMSFDSEKDAPHNPPVSTGPWPNGIVILLVPILIKHLSKWHERLRQGEKYYYSPKIESRAPHCTVCVFYFWFHDKCV